MISKLAEEIIDVAYKVKNPDGTWLNVPAGSNPERARKGVAWDEKNAVPQVVLGATRGFTRALDLADAERKNLIQHYDLPEDANLPLRNAGRGITGTLIGGIPLWLAYKAIDRNKHSNLKTVAAILASAGGLAGAEVMTEKYSPGHAREIRGNI